MTSDQIIIYLYNIIHYEQVVFKYQQIVITSSTNPAFEVKNQVLEEHGRNNSGYYLRTVI